MNFLSKREAARRVGFHPVHLMRLAKAGKFPIPVRIGEMKVAFIEDEVTAWQEAKIAERDAAAAKAAAPAAASA